MTAQYQHQLQPRNAYVFSFTIKKIISILREKRKMEAYLVETYKGIPIYCKGDNNYFCFLDGRMANVNLVFLRDNILKYLNNFSE